MMRPSQIALTTFYWAFIVYLFVPLALLNDMFVHAELTR